KLGSVTAKGGLPLKTRHDRRNALRALVTRPGPLWESMQLFQTDSRRRRTTRHFALVAHTFRPCISYYGSTALCTLAKWSSRSSIHAETRQTIHGTPPLRPRHLESTVDLGGGNDQTDFKPIILGRFLPSLPIWRCV